MSHIKDTNNELQSFVGTYISTYNGNHITGISLKKMISFLIMEIRKFIEMFYQ